MQSLTPAGSHAANREGCNCSSQALQRLFWLALIELQNKEKRVAYTRRVYRLAMKRDGRSPVPVNSSISGSAIVSNLTDPLRVSYRHARLALKPDSSAAWNVALNNPRNTPTATAPRNPLSS